MNTKEISLHMGAIAPPLKQQLREQGFTLPGVEIYQQQADAITRLNLGDILTDSQAAKACERLFKKIKGAVKL